jgi:type IX secretion system PorP/SprF family membrane protein
MRISVLLILILIGSASYAQQEPQLTQYMFNRVYMNPAEAGASGALCFSGIGRFQWIGLDDNEGNSIYPKTYGFSADLPIYSIKSGAGITFNYNKIGYESNINLKLNYAYHHMLKKNHMLSIGLALALQNKKIDYSKLETIVPDPSLPQSGGSGTITDVSLGIHYQIPRKFYAGFAASNLLGSSAEIGGPEFELARHYYLYAGYDHTLINTKDNELILSPGILLRATNGSLNADINAIVTYNNLFWGGLMYRVANSMGILAGIKYRGVTAGISWDYNHTSLTDPGHRSSIEIFVKYCYPIYPVTKKRSGYNTRNL